MPTSQNGYSAPITPVSRQLPGGTVPLRAGATGDLLAWVGRQFHARVEPLAWPGCWGYAYRAVRGATDLSNHASGTALDLNAPRHPLGTSPSANYSAGQIAAIHTIVAQTRGAVRWGGDYTGRKDGMHFEIVASEAVCAVVLAALTAQEDDVSLTTDQDRLLKEIHAQLTGSEKPGEYPGYQSFTPGSTYRATLTDYVRNVDARTYKAETKQLTDLTSAVTALTAKVDALAKKVGA
jgi:hypothetical protein